MLRIILAGLAMLALLTTGGPFADNVPGPALLQRGDPYRV